MADDHVRMYRILIYEGPRDWVERTLEKRYIKKSAGLQLGQGRRIIEAVVGEFPHPIDYELETLEEKFGGRDG